MGHIELVLLLRIIEMMKCAGCSWTDNVCKILLKTSKFKLLI